MLQKRLKLPPPLLTSGACRPPKNCWEPGRAGGGQGLGPLTPPGAGWGSNDPGEPLQARKRVVSPPQHHILPSPTVCLAWKKGGSGPILGLAARRLPTTASKPHPADASSSWEGRREIITGA